MPDGPPRIPVSFAISDKVMSWNFSLSWRRPFANVVDKFGFSLPPLCRSLPLLRCWNGSEPYR
jgi:hypothetical protein